jgi:hypothetical protein
MSRSTCGLFFEHLTWDLTVAQRSIAFSKWYHGLIYRTFRNLLSVFAQTVQYSAYTQLSLLYETDVERLIEQ